MSKKWFRRWFRKLFRRRFLVILLLVLQVAVLAHLIWDGSRVSQIISIFLHLVSVAAVLYIVSKRDKGAYKTIWVILILALPPFGGLLYLLFDFQASPRRIGKDLQAVSDRTKPLYLLAGDAYPHAQAAVPAHRAQMRYLRDFAGFPVYRNSSTRFLNSGEAQWQAMLQELEKAEHYIFLEYFIVEEGVMWDSILEILKRKASQGVLVRVLYDDMGCFLTLPHDYPAQLQALGIECAVFNPFRPILTATQNNRDHRKITVIDGKVAFTGGANLADEYINAIEKFGRWRDAAIRIEGSAAWSFTLMFLQMWTLCTQTNEDFERYYPWQELPCAVPSDGFVQPYADSPIDTDNVGEHVYLQIINNAKEYVYINTPYLIVDDSMVSALSLAAKSGVDVRIITPHRWDRWPVHMTTRSYYRELIKAGVKIYEFTNGFNHAKTFVSDDCTATVGTTNLDFRSLYLHFECGVLLFESQAVQQVKDDFLNTLERCHPITAEECSSNLVLRLVQDILRLFAPLM